MNNSNVGLPHILQRFPHKTDFIGSIFPVDSHYDLYISMNMGQ